MLNKYLQESNEIKQIWNKSAFEEFFTAIAEEFFLEGMLGIRLGTNTGWVFPNIS